MHLWFLYMIVLWLLVLILLNIIRIMQSRYVRVYWCLVMLFLPPIVYIAFGILAVYRLIVYIILKTRHGSKYNGFVKGLDAIHMTSKPSDRVINCLLMFKSKSVLSPEFIVDRIRDAVVQLQNYPKFKSKFCKFLGYYYMIEEEFAVEDCIREMATVTNEEHNLTRIELNALLNGYFTSDLPKNNTLPWEVIVGTQCMNADSWGSEEEFHYHYPILFRCEHAIADGKSLLQLLIHVFVNKEDNSTTPIIQENIKTIGTYDNFRRRIDSFVLLPAFFIVNYLSKERNERIWKHRNLCGRRFYMFNRDDSGMYKTKCRYIQQQYFPTRYVDVLLTLISDAIANYLKTLHGRQRVQVVTVTVSALTNSLEMSNIQSCRTDDTDLKIENRYAPFIIKLPVLLLYGDGRIEEQEDIVLSFSFRVHEVLYRRKDLICLSEYCMWRYYVNAVGSFFPQGLLGYITKLLQTTIIINIVPGPQRISCWNDTAYISDIIPFTPNAHGAGLTYTVITYDKRLFIGVSLDQSLIVRNQQETQQHLIHRISSTINHISSFLTIDPALH